jgi:hypothetical protein
MTLRAALGIEEKVSHFESRPGVRCRAKRF